MRELRCPRCGRANGVWNHAAMDDVRCAECEGPLDPIRHVRYTVETGSLASGPRIHADLLKAVADGDLLADMRIAEEGGPWIRARERPDLMPRGRMTRRAVPSPTEVPGSVAVMAAFGYVMTAILILVGVGVALVASAFGDGADSAALFFGAGLLATGQFLVARGIRAGSNTARILQLLAAGMIGVLVLVSLANGMPASWTLLGLMFASVPFVLLLSAEARAYFD